MKTILGLDLGTNSIGWALVESDFESKQGKILGIGSRIIPMTQDVLGDFDKGNSISQTAERTRLRSVRRLIERRLLRRSRLHRVLNVLGFLPQHYASQIDFEKKLGQFINEAEPKLPWKINENGRFEFLFQDLYHEMLADFKINQPDLINRKNRNDEGAKIPYDWSIYYLRKKALERAITKEQLAWLLLNFNQKRGYNQLRGEDDEKSNSKNEYVSLLKVIDIKEGNVDKKDIKKRWYDIYFENGWVYSATFTAKPDWINSEREFLVTEELDENGEIKIVRDSKKDKTGKENRKITPLPSFEEIDLMSKELQDKFYKKIKARTEITIKDSGKTVGSYIYETLLKNPNQKIRGKLIRTIERKFYKDELATILKKQIELQPEFFTEDLYNACIRELYRNNNAHQIQLSKRDFVHFFVDDILFYQRPLKSKKSSISNCPLECRSLNDSNGKPKMDNDGKQLFKIYKVTPKSNPLFQEFRVWQWLSNLKILKKADDSDVTADFIKCIEDLEMLFEFLMTKKEVNHTDILEYFLKSQNLKPKELKAEVAKYRWNYVFDDSKEKEGEKSKKYPCNETGYEINRRLKNVSNVPQNFLTHEIEYQLWHIIYSVVDKNQYETAIGNFIKRYNQKNKTQIDESKFKEEFIKFPPFTNEYSAYSEKAIKKLLPLLRIGKYWKWDLIDSKTKLRIGKIVTGEFDEQIKERVREKTKKEQLNSENDFQGLPLWLAQYVVYDRHSEASITGKWKSVNDLENYLQAFKQHSLRNPIVEQVVTETLRIVKDIWASPKYGKGKENFFDEIHIELGREMKNPAEERKRITNQVSANENTNLRIKALIAELFENSDKKLIVENVKPYSPYQQDALKIFEDGILTSVRNKHYNESQKELKELDESMLKIGATAQPTKSELQRYKLWLEQKYRSPYTGETIQLSKLFTDAYQIEHIIPQSRFFDDSFSNKVICEAAINKLKDNQLGLEFIKNHHGQKVETGFGKTVQIFSEESYINFVNEHYEKNRSKKDKLMLKDIPEKMIDRQLNDTRYISKFISSVLSNIVRADKNDEGVNSINVIPCNGKITSQLKQDWGLNDVWNDLILPRFERMNDLTKSNDFTTWNDKHQKYLPTVPLQLSKGFQKKRIDHRHHALDALVIACANRDHVQYLNNENAKSQKLNLQKGLAKKLRKFETVEFPKMQKDEMGVWQKSTAIIKKEVAKDFLKPWATFTEDTRTVLEKVIVSFKQNLRVINKTKFEGLTYKESKEKSNDNNWAIRQPLHKDTVYGKVELKRIKVAKGKILTATRKAVNTTFNTDTIESITDTGIQKILKKYLECKGGNAEVAFTPEGIDEMNKNIEKYNDGKAHQPIFKVRIFEVGSKFSLGIMGNKKYKYVETAKGTNLFFAVYHGKDDKRSFGTIPLNEVIERAKNGLSPVEFMNEKDFYLSPNDLVYIPTSGETENLAAINFENFDKKQVNRIYRCVSFTRNECHFTPSKVASLIKYYDANSKLGELGSLNKMENSTEDIQIKSCCIKLTVDRLGNIKPYNSK